VFNEFKKFALRGNVLDLAIGIIIGGAFNNVVSSLVKDVVMPPIGLLLGKVDFSNLFISLGGDFKTLSEAQSVGAPTINYGLFLNTIISFVITALAVFFLVRAINRVRDFEEKGKEATQTLTKECPLCKSSIHKDAVKCSACTSDLRS